MRNYRTVFMCFLAAMLVAFAAGCGQETVTLPGVLSVTPLPGATNVLLNAPITATFSMAMSAASLTPATFTVVPVGGVAVAGTSVTLDATGKVATLVGAALTYNTTYTATITTGAATPGGAELIGNYVWTFSTGAPTALTVAVNPTPFEPNVAVGTNVTATFSQAMNCATLRSPAMTFTVTDPSGVAVNGSVACVGSVATFTLADGVTLAYGTTYTGTITTGATDTAGFPLAAGKYVWTFTTIAATPPSVLTVVGFPAQGAHVLTTTPIYATFNLVMNCATLRTPAITVASNFTVTDSDGIVPGSVTCVDGTKVATFIPTGGALPLYNRTYTATITTGAASSVEGVSLPINYVWTFTVTPPLTGAPIVTATDPVTPNLPAVPEDVTVPLNQVVTATFNEAMAQNTINGTNFKLTYVAAGVTTQVSGTVGYLPGTHQLVFVPGGLVPVNLLPDTEYTATITGGASGVTDLAGTGMAVLTYPWNFHTVSGTSSTAPELVKTVPAPGASDVCLNQPVSATFDKGMNSQTLKADFLVWATLDPTKTPIQGSFRYSPSTFIATFTPTLPFAVSTEYTATVVGATDLFGNVLGNSPTAPYTNTWTFTTGTSTCQPPVVLGPGIAAFGGFGGAAGMTNTGHLTVVHGDIGTTGASQLMTGFYDNNFMQPNGTPGCVYTAVNPDTYGLVIGAIDTAPGTSFATAACPIEATAATGAIATEALLEATAAYTTLSTLPPGLNVAACCGGGLPGELGGRTLAPGIYTSTVGSYGITIGDLTLDAQGDPSAYWVFQMPSSSLTVGLAATPRSVILKNGAKASHVFWVVEGLPGAVINPGGGGTFVGTILSQFGIAISTVGNNLPADIVTIDGRVIALNASTTMTNTVINTPPAP